MLPRENCHDALMMASLKSLMQMKEDSFSFDD
jgi:hypothetical protein